MSLKLFPFMLMFSLLVGLPFDLLLFIVPYLSFFYVMLIILYNFIELILVSEF